VQTSETLIEIAIIRLLLRGGSGGQHEPYKTRSRNCLKNSRSGCLDLRFVGQQWQNKASLFPFVDSWNFVPCPPILSWAPYKPFAHEVVHRSL
jgi:hypothetical protein